MFSKTKKILILTVFFAVLLYGEGEGTSEKQDSGSSKSEAVKVVKSGSDEIEQTALISTQKNHQNIIKNIKTKVNGIPKILKIHLQKRQIH